MLATFRFDSVEYRIETGHGNVWLEKRKPVAGPIEPRTPEQPHSTGPVYEVEAFFVLSKSQARSLASAMMQAAAEL